MSPHAASYSPTRLHPDPLRISGTAAAIAINAAVLMLLLTPLRTPPLAAPDIVVVPGIFFPAKPKPVPPPPVPVVREVPVQRAPVLQPQARPAPTPVVESPPIFEQGSLPAPEVAVEPQTQIATVPGPTSTGPATSGIGMHLEYAFAPEPAYPREALRAGLEGSVLLQVTVDTDGAPIHVAIARSSGHRELDIAARRQVQSRWRFKPALQDGHPVQAIGLVAIDFRLH